MVSLSTHGIGPIAVYSDINRGNRFVSLTSHATKSRGLHDYIVKEAGPDDPNAKLRWKLGDVVTTTINTANGETIIVTHDTSLPRPYSLGFRVQGTNGLWEVDGNRIYIEGKSQPHQWDDASEWSAITPLSEVSIANNGEVQDFPDFTKANWIKRKAYDWMKDDF